LHAAGIRLDAPVAGLAEPDIVQHLMGPLHGVLPRHARQLSGIGYKLHSLDSGEKALVLGHEADGLPDIESPSADVLAEHFAGAAVDGNQAEEGADHRRLAGPVRPQQADSSLVCLDGEIAQRGDPAVSLSDMVQL